MDKLDAKVGVGPEASRRPGKEPQSSVETWTATPPRECGHGMHGDPEGPSYVFSVFGLQKAGHRQYKGTKAHVCVPDSSKDELNAKTLILAVATSKTSA